RVARPIPRPTCVPRRRPPSSGLSRQDLCAANGCPRRCRESTQFGCGNSELPSIRVHSKSSDSQNHRYGVTMSIGLVYIHNLSEAIRLWAQQEKVGAVVVLSGGQDSTTCLFWAKHVGFKEVHAVTFDYGQRNSRELDAARVVAKMAQVDSHEVIEVGSLLKGASPLIDHSMQLELFDEVRDLPGAGIQNTFVPMRNQLFLTVAANRAYVHGARALITGVSSVDSGGYPDCTVPFIHSIEHTCNTGTFTGKD